MNDNEGYEFNEDGSIGSKTKRVICPKCDPQSPNKWVLASRLQEHIKKQHIDWGDYTD